MKYKFLYYALLLCVAGCQKDQQNTGEKMPLLFFPPKIIALDTITGYALNQFSGDSIAPITGDRNDILQTGRPLKAGFRIFPKNISFFSKVIKAGSPLVFSISSNQHKIPDQLTKIPVIEDSLETFILKTTPQPAEVIILGDTIRSGELFREKFTNRQERGTLKNGLTHDIDLSRVPILAKGKVVPAIHNKPVKTLSPRSKDAATHNIQYLDTDQGLPSSYVWCTLEDKHGNIWLGTSNGACKYDGESYTLFTKKEGLLNDGAMYMLEDQKGNIWFASLWEQGICKYDGQNFTHFSEAQGFPCFYINCMVEDNEGNIWFGTGCGLCKYDGQYFTWYNQDDGLAGNQVTAITKDKYGDLWIATRQNNDFNDKRIGLTRFDGRQFIQFSEEDGLPAFPISFLKGDHSGNIWLSTLGGGVVRYDGKTLTHFTVKEGLSSNQIEFILEDRNEKLWFGTADGGLNRFDGQYFTHFTEEEGLPNNQVHFIMEDRAGNLWLSNLNSGIGIFREKSITHFTGDKGFTDKLILSMLEDDKGDLWFGTQGDGLFRYSNETITHYTTKEGLPNNTIQFIHQNPEGDFWFITGDDSQLCRFDGSYFTHIETRFNIGQIMLRQKNGDYWCSVSGGPICKFDEKEYSFLDDGEQTLGNEVFSILEDRKGTLWFGSKGKGGVFKYDGQSVTIYSEKEGLSDNNVTSLLEDKNGNIWIGTDGGGVNKFDGKSFTYYTEEQGLAGDGTWSLQEDADGNIWVGTQAGISMIRRDLTGDTAISKDVKTNNTARQLIINYTTENGLKGDDYYTNSMVDSKNRGWWNCGKALTMLDFNNWNWDPTPPEVQLNYLVVNDQYYDYRNMADSLKTKIKFSAVEKFFNYPINPKLSHKQNHLTFHFSGIDWSAPQKLQYSYRIEGLGNGWSPPSKETKAEFRNMPEGTFTFEIRAIGESQLWSDPYEYTFTVLPPWWWSKWTKAAYFLIGLSFLYGLYRFQLNRQLAAAETKRLNELNQFKSRFYTNITHEFRTPLTVISGMADQILEQPENWFREGLTMIKRNSLHLLSLVNQMLDLSKLDSGKLPIQMIHSDLLPYLKYLTDSFHSYAESKDIRLHLMTDLRELYMDFDPEKIQTIFSNLAGNAFKFTPPGGDICISIQEHSTNQSYCCIRITDTGAGIAEDQLPYIFDRFYQADDSVTRPAGGSGIGLSLTREMVKMLGGSIEVTSQLGKGTEFTVLLPIHQTAEKGDPETTLTEPSLTAPTNNAKKNLLQINGKNELPLALLIEDNPDVLRYLEACLINKYRLETALNGLQGIEKAIELIPDIIISDIMMPEKDGFEVCNTLKQDERTSHIPIILLTAKATMEDRVAGLQAGADAYLTKPFNKQELFVRLEKLVEIRRRLMARYQDFKLPETAENKTFQKEDAFLRKVNKAIEEHLSFEDFDATALCRAVNYSRPQLYHKLKALTGRSVAIYIRTLRLHRAKELLHSTDLNISEVAYEVGFKDPNYFSRKYREEFGSTPSQTRK